MISKKLTAEQGGIIDDTTIIREEPLRRLLQMGRTSLVHIIEVSNGQVEDKAL